MARRHANDGVGSIRLFPIQRSEGEKPDQNVHPKQAAVRLDCQEALDARQYVTTSRANAGSG